ncbi:MAG: hypothetical protein AAFR61_32735 [Bacteroidota bacterium]
MSKTYLKILELASQLSPEECLMLIKDISTAMLQHDTPLEISPERVEAMLESARATQAKVQSGEMKTWTLKEAKERVGGEE